MRPNKLSVAAAMALTVTACSTLRRGKTAAAPPEPPATVTVTTSVAPTPVAAIPGFRTATRSDDGVFAPGNDELVAIQAKYGDATMQTLKDGYAIYTGVCTNCHNAKSIYSRTVEAWPGIIDNMALEAKITNAQKDALTKYVMAIKATQP